LNAVTLPPARMQLYYFSCAICRIGMAQRPRKLLVSECSRAKQRWLATNRWLAQRSLFEPNPSSQLTNHTPSYFPFRFYPQASLHPHVADHRRPSISIKLSPSPRLRSPPSSSPSFCHRHLLLQCCSESTHDIHHLWSWSLWVISPPTSSRVSSTVSATDSSFYFSLSSPFFRPIVSSCLCARATFEVF